MPTYAAGEKAMEPRMPKPKMHHMRVTPADGGVIVSMHSHPHDAEGMGKPRVFSDDQGDELAAHLLKKAGISGASEEVGEEEHKHIGKSKAED